MRSSKSRSRSKNNRNNNNNRSVGNIVNRVFDSSGPEGKVRGTPQQIIDKYTQLTQDAQLGNDRVAAENFQQHAEHYTRILGIGMQEMEAKREQQEREQRDRQKARDEQNQQREAQNKHQNNQQQNQNNQQNQRDEQQHVDRGQTASSDPSTTEQPDVVETDAAPEAALVATPEETQPKRRAPRRRKPKEPSAENAVPEAPEAAAE